VSIEVFKMTYDVNWEKAEKYFLNEYKTSGEKYENLIAIANICHYIRHEYNGVQLGVNEYYYEGYSRLHIGVADGSVPSKELVVMPIQGNEVEIYLRDNETRIEHCYFQHPPHSEALNRFKKIINKLNWNDSVKPNNIFLDWLRD